MWLSYFSAVQILKEFIFNLILPPAANTGKFYEPFQVFPRTIVNEPALTVDTMIVRYFGLGITDITRNVAEWPFLFLLVVTNGTSRSVFGYFADSNLSTLFFFKLSLCYSKLLLNFLWLLVLYIGTITEKSAVTFSFGGDNLKRYFDQR